MLSAFARVLAPVFCVFTCACALSGTARLNLKPARHVYVLPVTNRTDEENLDVVFSRIADSAFHSDPRFVVDAPPQPGRTIVVKTVVVSVSSFAVGFDRFDRAVEYELTVKVRVELFRYGYRKPFKVLSVERYDYYSARGTAEATELRRKECMESIAYQIFREVAELMVAGEGVEASQSAGR